MFNTHSEMMLINAIANTYDPNLGNEIKKGFEFGLKNVFNGSNGKKKPSLEEQIKRQEEEVLRLEKCFKDVDEEKLDKLMRDYKEPYAIADKKGKKIVLKQFRKEFKNILITDHEWQKPVAHLVANMTKPEYEQKESEANRKKVWDKITELFVSTEGGAHLPQFYVGPLAKSMKIDREKLTKKNIYYGAGMMILAAGAAVGVPIIQDITEAIQQTPVIGDTYKLLGDYFIVTAKISLPAHFFWGIYRFKKHYKDNEHTPSLPSLIAPLPIPGLSSLANIYLFSYAGAKKYEFYKAKKKLNELKELYENTNKKVNEVIDSAIPKPISALETAVNYYKS